MSRGSDVEGKRVEGKRVEGSVSKEAMSKQAMSKQAYSPPSQGGVAAHQEKCSRSFEGADGVVGNIAKPPY